MGLTNRGIVWSLLPSLPLDFLNPNRAVKWLQGQGLGYHYQTLWHDVSSAFQTYNKAPLQREIASNEIIPKDLFIERDYRNPRKYYYYGRATFEDPLTGELYDRNYSLYVNRAMSDEELTESAYWGDLLESSDPERSWKVVGFETVEASHKWGAPY